MSGNTSKICVLHDTFIYKGGAERLMIMIAKILKSDLASGFFDMGSFDLVESGFLGKKIELGRNTKNKYLRQIFLQWSFFHKTSFLKEYETILLSGDCLAAVRNIPKTSKIIYYCHTPPRYIFDQKEEYMKKVPVMLRPIYWIFISLLRYNYLRSLKRIDIIYTNSENTQRRIFRFTGEKSKIIYPPVDMNLFKPSQTKGDYYFSYARLSSIKRIDFIVQAFQGLPDKKLLIHGGINDPETGKIKEMIKGFPNIEYHYFEKQEDLIDAAGSAIANIYIPKDEDFGMIPVESMSCGVPVIGINEGGLKESILQEKTGILLPPDEGLLIENLRKAIIQMDASMSNSMRDDCIARAEEFSIEHFEHSILSTLQ